MNLPANEPSPVAALAPARGIATTIACTRPLRADVTANRVTGWLATETDLEVSHPAGGRVAVRVFVRAGYLGATIVGHAPDAIRSLVRRAVGAEIAHGQWRDGGVHWQPRSEGGR
jgi:hypothetical protein